MNKTKQNVQPIEQVEEQVKSKPEEQVLFQIIDWDFFHEEDDDGNKKFAIRLFGRNKEEQTVYVQVDDFQPYFYIELQDDWRISTVDTILEEVKKKVPKCHVESLTNFKIEPKYKFWGFTNYKIFKYAKLTFESYDGMKAYARALTKAYKIPSISRKWIKLKLYESNILPVLRFMHIRELEAVGWVSIDKSKVEEFDSPPSCCKLNYKTKWSNVKKVDDRSINKFIIASFDIECKSEDGSFPQPQRENDRIIQIGITLSKYGETECYERHLLSLKKTDEINGVHVQSFNTEEELLLGFTKTLRTIDPDIITGYNIFGFDFMYMMERAKKLGILHKFEKLSRINDEQSPWVDQTLTSAALGTNLMKYYKMTGRVLVDLMKVAQRDFKLSSYKLDYVSSYFIRELILNIIENKKNNTFKIITKSTYGVNVGQYITISYDDGSVESKYNEGEKFKILEVDKDYLVVSGSIDTTEFMGKGYKISWCQAKDDVSPQDIFRLADGTPQDRAVIGKYCVMDCELVSKLMAKLQIITNNVSMANVCNVPLSYLFLRGQGVKIFSLVAKKCREKNHLIPVIQKKEKKKDWANKSNGMGENSKIDQAAEAEKRMEKMLEKLVYQLNNKNKEEEEIDDEEELSYEGAIVFPPKPGVYFEPIPVLDYASLYPSSMIFRNLSHECFVNDPKYDNLPGYRYHVITYKVMTKEDMEMTAKEKKEKEKLGNTTEEWITCRFAEKLDGTKGIIPEILQDLLSARKKFKKLMETEKDPFMKSILDGLQLAYKVTANSLYGQTGASTSPICMKEIAASTTATGREMLQFSKYFIENTFAEMIDLALTNKKKYLEKMEKTFKYFPTNISYPDINRATGKITTVNLHVCTDENFTIPDDKFIVKSIEYDDDCHFDQNLANAFLQIKKKVKTTVFPEKDDPVKEFAKKIYELTPEKMNDFIDSFNISVNEKDGASKNIYKNYSEIWKILQIDNADTLKSNLMGPISKASNDIKEQLIEPMLTIIEFKNYFDNLKLNNKLFFDNFYSHVLEKSKPLDDIEFSAKFKSQIFSLKVEERNVFLEKIKKYILKKKGTAIDIYEKYQNIWNNLEINNSDILKKYLLKPIQEMTVSTKEIFIENLQIAITDLGYSGREELYQKFYEFVNETMKGYTTKPEVIYGDSITPDEVLLLKDESTNKVFIKRIDELCNQWEKYEGFKTNDAVEYFVNIVKQLLPESDNKMSSNSEIKKIKLNNGITILCDNIDLLYFQNNNQSTYDNLIKTFLKNTFDQMIGNLPKKIKNMLNLFEISFKSPIDLKSSSESELQIDCRRTNICLKNLNQSMIDEIKSMLLKDHEFRYSKEQSTTNYLVWSGNEWTKIKRVIRHKTNKKIYRVMTSTSVVDVTEDHSLIDQCGQYIKPSECDENTMLLQSYPNDLTKLTKLTDDTMNMFESDNKEECSLYYFESKSKGYNVLINYDFVKHKFCLRRTNDIIKDSNKLVSITLLKPRSDEYSYVYDLETVSGKFHAGVGELIVKNTDSVFFRMGFTDIETGEKLKDKKALVMAIKIGIWSSILISTLLPKPQAQAYEKVLYPFIIQGKKRYCANLYEKDPEKFKQKSMGIELKRRDNANIVKVMCAGIIDQILNLHSAEGAYEFARNTLHKIITGGFKMDKFIITKTLKGNSLTKQERKLEALKPKEERTYADRTRIVHAVLADRMADRDPGNRPLSNDRIPYAYVEPKGKVTLQGDRVETPEYIIENKLKLDYLFYITNQIKTPALKFLDLLIENAEAIFREFEIKEENRKHCMMPIAYYADKDEVDYVDFDDTYSFDNADSTNTDDDASSIDEKQIKQKQSNKSVSFDKLESNLKSEFKINKKTKKKVLTKSNNIIDKSHDEDKLKNMSTYKNLLENLNEIDNKTIPEKLKNKKKQVKPTKKIKSNDIGEKSISTHDLMEDLF